MTECSARPKSTDSVVRRRPRHLGSRPSRKFGLRIVLERPSSGTSNVAIDKLFDGASGGVFVCSSPSAETLSLLSRKLSITPVTAEGIVNDLYRLVAEASTENASVAFDKRRRISPTEVERRILDRLDAEDSAAIHAALSAGLLAPVDLTTPVQESAFYQGVKVRPGHVPAGLVLERTADTTKVATALGRHKHVVLTGPSGAGKSRIDLAYGEHAGRKNEVV